MSATEQRDARPRPQSRAEPADHGRAAGGACPHSRLYRELELARLANATPPAEQALRERLAKDRTARPLLWLRSWILLGTLLLALMAGIYASTGRYQAWQAYQSRPDPLAGLSPRDLQDKALGALHQRLQANPADLDGWAALGQLYLYRDEYANALLAYQRLALQEGRQRGDPGRPGYRALLPGRPAAHPGGAASA